MKPLIFLVCLILIIENISIAQPLAQNHLRVKITVPYPYSLIRGDVPIYGVACGEGFKEYKLEYGEGENPQAWKLIVKSEKPQLEENSWPKVDFSLDKTIPGNLGVWDTGLSEYEYGKHLVDLPMGTYTLKLTVSSRSGDIKEDRVVVEVGRVVLNAFSSKLESIDAKADLLIQEHSLQSAAGVFSLKPLNIKAEGIPQGYRLIGDVYEVNPPGEKFTRKAQLAIVYDKSKVSNAENLGIFVFNPEINDWQYLETFCDEKTDRLEAEIDSLPEKFAVYAVFEAKTINNRISQKEQLKVAEPISPVLANDTFENGLDQWKNKHGAAGAVLELDSKQNKDKGYCLKIIDRNGGGNFASLIRSEPFDARIYIIVKFDYRIDKDVKTNFLVKVNNKWYDIVFTDDEKVYWDINMEKIGEIAGVIADNRWHCAELNLYEMLRSYTDEFIVQEMVMADWDSTGFKKLEFGHNPKGATYYIDNFEIKSGAKSYIWCF
ncbi:MAG: hypothetical protein KKH34_02460 [Candidatus Omnitrophica bacterium]|nr:hypothetical protein [Candidatus Omnitrophota bacterium]MCG2704106.1 hypothetical protein [Candidatus Omnitrophota bacterium]